MPIYLDNFNLLVPKKVIAEKYQGGISQFLKDFRFAEFEINQEDDELFSLGQMNYDCLPIDELVEKGLHYDDMNHSSHDFIVIARYGKDLWNAPWIKHNKVFAWHINAHETSIKKAEKISNTDVAEIMELIVQGKSPLKTIRIGDNQDSTTHQS